jgi:hypothetical protein
VLTSLLGVRVVLWVGKTVPTPAPLAALTALSHIEITNDASEGDGFQLVFRMQKQPPLDYSLLTSGTFAPLNRVIVGVIMGVLPEVLIDGVVTHLEVNPNSDPGMSTLTVTGKDVSQMLDLKEKNESYPNQPDSVIVLQLIAQYAQYGLIPQVTPTTDVPIMINRIPRQQETDLRFIKRMAERNGYVFYVEPVTFGVNTAYWGPEIRAGLPQPAITVDMGHATNATTLNFTNDALAPVGTESTVVEPITGLTIPIPSLPSLRLPPLAPLPAAAERTVILRDSAKASPTTALVAAAAAATTAPEAVRGEGELDGVRYGAVLRARKVVGVRGAGFTYNGLYYVRRVTHVIEIGKYTQRFVITREGTGAITPVVRP